MGEREGGRKREREGGRERHSVFYNIILEVTHNHVVLVPQTNSGTLWEGVNI